MNSSSLRIARTPEVTQALQRGLPVVALESAVITHGLPRPSNHALARGMEQAIRDEGATPATIAVLHGQIHVGLTTEQLQQLAQQSDAQKISPRNLAAVLLQKGSGGTTVAGALWIARRAGLKVFATGGIGGVYSPLTLDISADLPLLAESPLIVVCAGAKAIHDLPATLEYLETVGVPVIGYQTNEFPAFYWRESGLPVTIRLDTPKEVADFARLHWGLGMHSAVLVCQPPPREQALPRAGLESLIHRVRAEAEKQNIRRQALTPFLLQRLNDLTHDETLRTNLALLLHNASLAARIACAMPLEKTPQTI
jgi:pseudouridine-5'-phosphate glycosidase